MMLFSLAFVFHYHSVLANLVGGGCKVPLNKSSVWAHCQCESLLPDESGPVRRRSGAMDLEGEGGRRRDGMVRLHCEGLDWPAMGNLSEVFGGQPDKEQELAPPSIGALTIRGTRVHSLGQDAFRSERAIQYLELSDNAIDSVNANAFRGLEGQLFHLDLGGNRLDQVPNWALTYLRQLQHLQLSNNRIARLDGDTFAEAHLKNLRYLHLDGNKISSLPSGALLPLPLQVLTLANNRIMALQNGSLPRQLWFLDLKNNLLQRIPIDALEGLSALKTLDLERNNISELGAGDSGWRGVETELDLQLAHNRIQRLFDGALDGFRRFGRLDLSHNQINHISEKAFRHVLSILELDLGSNSLLQIPQNAFFRFAHSLRKLNLEQNQLGELPHALRPMMALQQLNLNGNRIRSLDAKALARFKANLTELSLARNALGRIPSEALQGMTFIRSLDLSRNGIGTIGKMAFGTFDGIAQSSGVSSLQRISLAGNRIRELAEPGAFLYLGQLAFLDLSHNRISRLTKATMERLEGLEWLSLDHNEMLEFPRNALSSLMRLRQFSMESNLLTLLPNYAFQWLIHLQRLSLARNRLHTLNAKTFHSTSAIQIKWLSLAHNRISKMETAAFQNLPNLEQLFLHHNRLTTLQTQILSSLKNLRQLTLAHNRINETQESAFTNLPHLEQLSLAHNKLRTIKEGVFHKLPSLAHLDLSYNRIEAFDLDFLGASVHQLRVLDLSFNMIRKLEIQPAKHSLRSLNLCNNQLEFVHGQMLQGFDQLRSVDLSHNDLIDLNAGAFWGSVRIEQIVLAENNLRTIWRDTFRDQNLVHSIDLRGNVLHSLDPGVFGRDNLLELDLSRNNFSAIPVRALASVRNSLTALRMSRNGLKDLRPADLEGMVNLTVLELAENRIEVLEEEMFANLPRLRRLDLSDNPVSTWSPHTFLGLSPSLEHLDLSRSGLFSLPKLSSLSSLRLLNLSGNFLYELPPSDVDQLPALRVLDLARNRLAELRADLFERMPELKRLNLSENGLQSLQEEHLTGLAQIEHLTMAKMPSLGRLPDPAAFSRLQRLNSLEFHSVPALQMANFSLVQLFHSLPPLRSLHFESKQERFTGKELAQTDLRLLRDLTITGSKVREIDPNAFARLRGFRLRLAVENTRIVHFPSEALAQLNGVSFVRLSLRNNSLARFNPFPGDQRIPLLNERGTVLESIDLRGNPLECDCRMEWLSEWISVAEQQQGPSGGAGTAQWTAQRESLMETLCANSKRPWNGNAWKKAESVNLLDAYQRTRFSWQRRADYSSDGQNKLTANAAPELHDWEEFEGEVPWMLCDEEGRRISGAISTRQRGSWLGALAHLLLTLATASTLRAGRF